jgi:hypothetical protein
MGLLLHGVSHAHTQHCNHTAAVIRHVLLVLTVGPVLKTDRLCMWVVHSWQSTAQAAAVTHVITATRWNHVTAAAACALQTIASTTKRLEIFSCLTGGCQQAGPNNLTHTQPCS